MYRSLVAYAYTFDILTLSWFILIYYYSFFSLFTLLYILSIFSLRPSSSLQLTPPYKLRPWGRDITWVTWNARGEMSWAIWLVVYISLCTLILDIRYTFYFSIFDWFRYRYGDIFCCTLVTLDIFILLHFSYGLKETFSCN